jgi:hypothetical protein
LHNSSIVRGFILLDEAVSIWENTDIISNEKVGIAAFTKKNRKKWSSKA